MNFLAHAYLSFGSPDILIGNLIADLVKGKQIATYPEDIQKGIYIHRQIDAFTDQHPITHETSKLFRPSAGKYAGPFLDVSYDHFLALDEKIASDEGWQEFADKCYQQIELYGELLPPKFCSMFMYMKSENWFYNYRYRWMIERSFDRLKNRATYLDDNAPVFNDFETHYDKIKAGYEAFFPELELFVKGIS